ncbi:phospholipase D family protein, partial [bacterium]|nr:phospholipase D family protein [bacterium]
MKRPIGHLYKSENFLQANNLESQMLLLENKLSKAIKDLLLTETKLRIAVAFIGDGACNLINQRADDVKIVCNLSMGGTNPNEIKEFIRRFGKKNVKHIDNLHAKLYIGTEYAIVGSANMSSNGLGTQPTALREAGYKFKVDQPSGKRSADWFDELWADACGITTKDLKNAEDKWNRRDRNRNGEVKTGSRDICDYDFDCKNFPLLD